jgi:AAA+ superfamily predicted ATPase
MLIVTENLPVFLRLLEYYQGILILTTNRVNVFDPAIKSRIHLAIKYHPLTAEFRRDLWRVFVNSACSGTSPEWLTDACLDRLAAEVLNGRQIKNTVRTAQALAVSEQCELLEKHLEQSMNAMSMFERDFGEMEAEVDEDGDGDDDGDRERSGFNSRKRPRLF